MDNDYPAQFLVSAFAASLAALLDLAVSGTISWQWVLLGFVVAFGLLYSYQGLITARLRPFKRWRIAPGELISYFAVRRGDSWEFDRTSQEGHGFFGPYVPLTRGRYRVTYRLKIDARDEQDQPVCELDVTSNSGQKWFAQRTVSVRDFHSADSWQSFSMPFDLSRDENMVEFRLRMKNIAIAQKRITFDFVTLRRRLL